MRDSRLFTRDSMPRSAGPRVGWSAASSLDRVPATTPPAAATPSATSATAIAALTLNLNMDLPFPGTVATDAYPDLLRLTPVVLG
jgi:hypothetical protein